MLFYIFYSQIEYKAIRIHILYDSNEKHPSMIKKVGAFRVQHNNPVKYFQDPCFGA